MDPYHSRGDWRAGVTAFEISELELGIIHHAGIKYQAGDVLSRLRTKGKNKIALNDEVPALTISQAFLAYDPETEVTDFEFTEECGDPSVNFVPRFCIMTGSTDSSKEEIQMLAEFPSV